MNENEILFQNYKQALLDPVVYQKVSDDYSVVFEKLRITNPTELALFVISSAISSANLEESEFLIEKRFEELNIFQNIKEGMAVRLKIVLNQILPFLKIETDTNILDFGCGAGLVANELITNYNFSVEGCDVRDFRKFNTFKFVQLGEDNNEYTLPVPEKYYSTGILLNVIHHEKENDKILTELNRVVANKLIIIETVLDPFSALSEKQTWQVTFCNDVLWNRYFNYADIPVPGTYQKENEWITRFENKGWKCTHTEFLGIDQPTINDAHHLFVFEKQSE